MIKFNNKTKPIKYFDEINKAVLDNISDNIASLIQKGKYRLINTTDTKTTGF